MKRIAFLTLSVLALSVLVFAAPGTVKSDCVIDLGVGSAGDTSAEAINAVGVIVGRDQWRPCVWRDGKVKRLPLMPSRGGDLFGPVGDASSINDSGVVVGTVGNEYEGGDPLGANYRAVEWRNGDIRDLEVLPPTRFSPGPLAGYECSTALSINDSGIITGRAVNASMSQAGHEYRAANWTLIDSVLHAAFGVYPISYNNKGDHVQAELAAGDRQSIVLYSGGHRKVVEELPYGHTAMNVFVNDRLDIAATLLGGIATYDPYEDDDLLPATVVLWTAKGRQELDSLPRYPKAWAYGLDNQGDLVGEAVDTTPPGPLATRAVLWHGGQTIDLTATYGGPGAWIIKEANAINDKGWIVGVGSHTDEGTEKEHALLIKPSAP